MFLIPENQKAVGLLLNSPLWADIKRCLNARRPPPAVVTDEIHVAAAKGNVRAGYEQAIADIEKLPFEHDAAAASPFERPALDNRD